MLSSLFQKSFIAWNTDVEADFQSDRNCLVPRQEMSPVEPQDWLLLVAWGIEWRTCFGSFPGQQRCRAPRMQITSYLYHQMRSMHLHASWTRGTVLGRRRSHWMSDETVWWFYAIEWLVVEIRNLQVACECASDRIIYESARGKMLWKILIGCITMHTIQL